MATARSSTDETEDFQVPLMNVFRSAALEHDERRAETAASNEDREISQRQIERREGISHDRLQRFFLDDLANLMSTVHMECVEDLSEFPYVQKSVLNYGIEDVTSLHDIKANYQQLGARLKKALIDHEPRLKPETVVVRLVGAGEDSKDQKPSFEVEAVMAARPVDVPLEFVAEVDATSGKVFTSKLTVQE